MFAHGRIDDVRPADRVPLDHGQRCPVQSIPGTVLDLSIFGYLRCSLGPHLASSSSSSSGGSRVPRRNSVTSTRFSDQLSY